jgi:hypothetical protein
VLQQRQFVLAAAHRGDQPLGERFRDEAVEHLRGAAHRAQQRVVVHSRHEILGAVDGLGKTGEARAFA